MNKTIASVSAAAVLGVATASAQWVPSAAELGVTSDLTIASQFVPRGVEAADWSFQPSVEASFGDFYMGLWSNLPLEPRVIDAMGRYVGNTPEINYYGGFTIRPPEMRDLVLDMGITVYHWPRANLDRSHEIFAGAKMENIRQTGVSVSAYYFYDLDIKTHVVESSVGYSIALERWGLPASLDLSALLGIQSGSEIEQHQLRVSENYYYYGASVEVPMHLSPNSTLTAGVHYRTAEDFNPVGVGRDNNLFWTLSYTAGF